MKYLLIFLAYITTVSCSSTQDIYNDNSGPIFIKNSMPLPQYTSYLDNDYTPALNQMNAIKALEYSKTLTTKIPGDGVGVLVIDSGIALDHPAFASKNITVHHEIPLDSGYDYYNTANVSGVQSFRGNEKFYDVMRHGTQVASIIIANDGDVMGFKTMGVASGANLGFLPTNIQKPDGSDATLYSTAYKNNGNDLSNIIKNNNYRVVNMSYGHYNGGTTSTEADAIKNIITNNDVLFVAATGNGTGGNNGQDNSIPIFPARNAKDYNTSAYKGGVLAVTAYTEEDYKNETFVQNQCGDAKNFCLAAPTNHNGMANAKYSGIHNPTDSQYEFSAFGTSYATPVVSGAVAWVNSVFPTLTTPQVRDFILRGATPIYFKTENIPNDQKRIKGGIAIDSILGRANSNDGIVSSYYGYGLLDIYETMKLVNNTTVKGTNSTFGSSKLLTSSSIGSAIENFRPLVTTTDQYGQYTLQMNTHSVVETTPFNSMITSNAYLSQVNTKSFGIRSKFGSFNTNIINKNIFTKNSNVVSQSRFSDMDNTSNAFARNSFGVVADSNTVANQLTNITYKGSILGFNVSVFSKFQPGLTNNNFASSSNSYLMRETSVDFNPFIGIISNSFNANSISISKHIKNFKLHSITTIGNSNFTVSMVDTQSSKNLSHIFGAEYIKNNNTFSFDVGVLKESSSMLGTYSSGAFSIGNGNTTSFIKIKNERSIGVLFGRQTQLTGSIALGRTNINATPNSLFSDFSSVLSRSFIVGLNIEEVFGGNIKLTYSQPLKIISGDAYFNGGHGLQKISLTPSQQEKDFGILFVKESKNITASIQGLYITNRNNMDVKPTFGSFVSMSFIF